MIIISSLLFYYYLLLLLLFLSILLLLLLSLHAHNKMQYFQYCHTIAIAGVNIRYAVHLEAALMLSFPWYLQDGRGHPGSFRAAGAVHDAELCRVQVLQLRVPPLPAVGGYHPPRGHQLTAPDLDLVHALH